MAADLQSEVRRSGHEVLERQFRTLPMARRGPRAFRLARHSLRAVLPSRFAAEDNDQSFELNHIHSIGDALSSQLLKVTRRAPTAWTVHDFGAVCPKTTLLRRSGTFCADSPLVCRMWARQASRFVASLSAVVWPSEFIRDEYRK